MQKHTFKYFEALAVMVGYILGVGMFSLPFIVVQAGVVPFFALLLILIPVQYLLHLIYASMIVASRNYHRLPGYTELYLGKKWKTIVFFGKTIGNVGALLAYTIVSGVFLNDLLHPYLGDIGSPFIYGSALFFIEAFVVYLGVEMIAKTELWMTAVLFLVVILIVADGAPHVAMGNFALLDWKYFVLPYGALLFALDGTGSLPIVARILNKDKVSMKKVVRHGTFLSALVTIVFTLIVVGISGADTTPDALVGLHAKMDGIIELALVFGLFSIITSFFGVAETIIDTLNWDYKLNKTLAWALAIFIPYGLYLIGIENLEDVISFVGSIGGGICSIVLVIVFGKLSKGKKKVELFDYKPSAAIRWFLISLFLAGIAYTLWEYFIK